MISNKLVIDKKVFFYIFIVIAWMLPSRIISLFSPYESYFEYLLQGGVGLLFLYRYGIRKTDSPFTKLFLIYLLAYLPGTIMFEGAEIVTLIRWFCWVVSLWGMLSFFSFADDYEKQSFLKALRIVFVIYLILSYAYIPMNPDVDTGVYFVGSRASTVQSLFTCLTLSIYYDVRYNEKVSFFSLVTGFFSLGFAVIRSSGQGMMMFSVLILCLVIDKLLKNKLFKWMNPIAMTIIVFALNYMLITLTYLNVDIVVDFITNILGKDATLTGRSNIFTYSVQIFLQHPLIGYGYNNSIVEDTISSIVHAYNSAHNSILQMMIDCGVIGTFLFGASVFSSFTIMRSEDEQWNSILYFSAIAMFVGGLVNLIIPTNYFMLVILLGASSEVSLYTYTESDNDS